MSRPMDRLLLSVAVLLACPAAIAWGPATHVYILKHVNGLTTLPAVYGAMAPDCCSAIRDNPTIRSNFRHLTHYEFELLDPDWFAIGFATHNNQWGADYYAHLYYDPEADDIYSTIKIRQLSNEFGLTMQEAEDVFEGAIDYLVRREWGPSLGYLIAASAAQSSYGQRLVDTYAQPLAQRVSGLSEQQAAQEIEDACTAFQILTEIYGEHLTQDIEELNTIIPSILARYLGCDTETATIYFERAVEICQDDYRAELLCVAAEVRARMGLYPEYEVPVAPRSTFMTGLLIFAVAVLRLTRRTSNRFRGEHH